MSQYKIQHGNYNLSYSLEYSERKTMTINVLPDLSVVVKVPETIPQEKVEEKVKDRLPWIIKQRKYFEQFLPPETPRQYISGETHRYLGRQYRLKIRSSEKDVVKLKGKFFLLYSKNKKDSDHNKQLLTEWYRQHGSQHFKRVLSRCYRKLRKYGVERPSFEIRPMKKRWGSSDPKKGIIRFNINLIKAPIHCIEYVVMHELVHLKYPYHDKEFYNLLSLVMSDWEERKIRLEMVKF